jgi:hypothetical protein
MVACASLLACSDGLFQPILPVESPGDAVMHLDGAVFDAEATFQGSAIRIEVLTGEFVVDLEVAELKNGRARIGRHRLQTESQQGTQFYVFERLAYIAPPTLPPSPSPPPSSVLYPRYYRVLDGFLEVRRSDTDEVNAVLYVRADTGPGTREQTLRLAFSALADQVRDHTTPTPSPTPFPPSPIP